MYVKEGATDPVWHRGLHSPSGSEMLHTLGSSIGAGTITRTSPICIGWGCADTPRIALEGGGIRQEISLALLFELQCFSEAR